MGLPGLSECDMLDRGGLGTVTQSDPKQVSRSNYGTGRKHAALWEHGEGDLLKACWLGA